MLVANSNCYLKDRNLSGGHSIECLREKILNETFLTFLTFVIDLMRMEQEINKTKL